MRGGVFAVRRFRAALVLTVGVSWLVTVVLLFTSYPGVSVVGVALIVIGLAVDVVLVRCAFRRPGGVAAWLVVARFGVAAIATHATDAWRSTWVLYCIASALLLGILAVQAHHEIGPTGGLPSMPDGP